MVSRATLTRLVPAAICLSLTAVISCNEARRQKILTFFFDGVPPLGGDPNALEQEDKAQHVPEALAEVPEKPKVFIHKPRRECDLCHGKREKKGMLSAEVKLVAKPPQLCFKCHPDADYSESTEFVHGPLAVAECLFCHHHHQSKNEHLLKMPVPDICYQCHEKDDIDAIPDHSEETVSACLNCHTGHSSTRKGLLKSNLRRYPERNLNEG